MQLSKALTMCHTTTISITLNYVGVGAYASKDWLIQLNLSILGRDSQQRANILEFFLRTLQRNSQPHNPVDFSSVSKIPSIMGRIEDNNIDFYYKSTTCSLLNLFLIQFIDQVVTTTLFSNPRSIRSQF